MTLVVTGASGHLGRRTAELLLKTGGLNATDVVLLTRSPDTLTDLAALGAQVRRADFADPDTLPAAFAGATRVLLISVHPGAARVDQHRAAIEAARHAGAQLIAYTSFPNPDPRGNPASMASDHAATEAAILDSGVPYAFLRNAVYSEYVESMSAGNPSKTGAFVHNFGDGAAAFVSRQDCAAAGAAVLAGGDEHANKTYDIVGPEAVTGADVAASLTAVRGVQIEEVSVDDATWVAEAVANGLPEAAARSVASFGRAIREGAFKQRSGDVERITGRAPISVRAVLAG